MQKHSSTQQQSLNVVKVDPFVDAISQLRNRQLWLLVILTPPIPLFYFLSAAPGIPQWEAQLELGLSPLLLGLEIIVLMQLGSCLAIMRHLKRANLKRQLAAYTHHGVASEEHLLPPLVTPQPLADAADLPLPTIIRYRPHWRNILVSTGLSLGIFLLFIVLILSLAYWATSMHLPAFSQIPPIFELPPWTIIVLLAAFLIRGYLHLRTRQLRASAELEITEQGLSWRARWSKQERSIAWSEAHLLAIEGYPGRRWSQSLPALYYELASEREVVRWLALTKRYPSKGYPRFIPISRAEGMGPEEYQRKIQALLSMIRAKTDLRLYDLR